MTSTEDQRQAARALASQGGSYDLATWEEPTEDHEDSDMSWVAAHFKADYDDLAAKLDRVQRGIRGAIEHADDLGVNGLKFALRRILDEETTPMTKDEARDELALRVAEGPESMSEAGAYAAVHAVLSTPPEVLAEAMGGQLDLGVIRWSYQPRPVIVLPPSEIDGETDD